LGTGHAGSHGLDFGARTLSSCFARFTLTVI
jgi:hypothetical protein